MPLDIIKDPVTGNQYSRDTSIPGSTYSKFNPKTMGSLERSYNPDTNQVMERDEKTGQWKALSTSTSENNSSTYISPTLTKSDYITTPPGKEAATNTSNNPTDEVLPPGLANSGLTGLKDEAFRALVPTLVPGTPEYQAALDKIDTSFYDIMQQQMTASTEQQKQVADFDYKQLKDYISNNLGITLSNDSIQAWDQLQGLRNQYSSQGTQGSGLEAESIDNYLNKVRHADSTARSEAKTKEESAQETYYRTYATPEQVKALVASNPELAKSYGLSPTDGLNFEQRVAALKTQFPSMSDANVIQATTSMYDKYGNYRSALQQKYITGSNLNNSMGGSIDQSQVRKDADGNVLSYGNLNPVDTGILDIQSAKKIGQVLNAEAQNELDVRNSRAAAGLTPPNTGTDPNTNTQFLNQAPKPNTTTTPPVGSAPATIQNPVPDNTTKPVVVPPQLTSQGTQSTNAGMLAQLDTAKKSLLTLQSQLPKASVPVTTPTTPVSSLISPYRVLRGDTLSAIAAKNKTTVSILQKLNNIKDANKIQVGQTLKFR